MIFGMKCGETRRGPRSIISLCCSTMPEIPPMPVPTMAPQLSRFSSGSVEGSRPASARASCVAFSANIVNGSSLRNSGPAKSSSGFQSTDAAKRTVRSSTGKRVIGVTPFSPASMRAQEVLTSGPRALTVPKPVITTRRMAAGGSRWKERGPGTGPAAALPGERASGLGLDVLDCRADRLDLLGVLVRDGDLELVLELHHQLDGVQGVRPQVVHERRLARDLVRGRAHLVANDALDALFDRRVRHCLGVRVHQGRGGLGVPCAFRG